MTFLTRMMAIELSIGLVVCPSPAHYFFQLYIHAIFVDGRQSCRYLSGHTRLRTSLRSVCGKIHFFERNSTYSANLLRLLSYCRKMANDRLDIVIFGATGFTGKFVVKNATHMCKDRKLRFGIAGRRKEALDAVVTEFASDIEDIPIILADVKDEESLKKMAERAKVLINCCGPYRFYGEPVVKACIATRTHYVDVTAEIQFILKMQLEYNEAAKEAGVYIVSACGFDCIPSDLGIIFTQQKFEGEVNAIEMYLKWTTNAEKKGPYASYGTYESLLYSACHLMELRELRAKLYTTKLPEFTPKLKKRSVVHRSDVSKGWSVWFPCFAADRPVALRTQRFLYDKYKERPVQVQFYATIKSFFELLMLAIFGATLLILSQISCSRNLLLKYPALFTYGLVSREKPDIELFKSTHFDMTFVAYGWTEKLAKPTDKHTDPSNKKVITKISSVSPGYEMTSIVVILSAMTILNEIDKIPDNGGVLTPGAAFGKTSLIEQMIKHNIKFEVISTEIQNKL
ncbi:saccharopine dehydrogenase-like oxidoreductase [Monomorium pharaonis]|uniref:saccharopine dehydrogenase-like oxidoreductase n=1 Tax=Monomorium pharaonis TaxID=307658 RepID=UPI001746CB2C|nr:saccharopine dehydrogenase-like oxidoreductase [Monomorium pharaonis]